MAPQSAAASCRAAQRPGNREPGLAHEAGKATDTMYKIDAFTMTAVNDSLSAHEESTKHYDVASGYLLGPRYTVRPGSQQLARSCRRHSNRQRRGEG